MARKYLSRKLISNTTRLARFVLPLPDYCQDILYHRLLDKWLAQHPTIAQAIVWEFPDGPRPYPEWPFEMRDKLRKAFPFSYPFQLVDPPPNQRIMSDYEYPGTFLSTDDAWALYLNHVAQSLAGEFWGSFEWSLEDLASDALAIMLDSRAFFSWSATTDNYVLFNHHSGRVLPAPPDQVFTFLSSNNLVAEDRLQTIGRLLNWCRDNLIHFSGRNEALNMEYQWGYRGYPPVSRILEGTPDTNPDSPDPELKHRSAGCHGTNGFLRAVLRVVNIPVLYQRPPGSDHATPVFPSEEKYMTHGDDPYSALVKSTPPFPALELLIDKDQYDEWFPPGAADPDYNISRQTVELAIIHLPDYLLQRHCYDLSQGHNHAQSLVYQTLLPFYTVQELEAMNLWDRLDQKVASFGGCANIP